MAKFINQKVIKVPKRHLTNQNKVSLIQTINFHSNLLAKLSLPLSPRCKNSDNMAWLSTNNSATRIFFSFVSSGILYNISHTFLSSLVFSLPLLAVWSNPHCVLCYLSEIVDGFNYSIVISIHLLTFLTLGCDNYTWFLGRGMCYRHWLVSVFTSIKCIVCGGSCVMNYLIIHVEDILESWCKRLFLFTCCSVISKNFTPIKIMIPLIFF